MSPKSSYKLTPDIIEALYYQLRRRNSTIPFIFCRPSDRTPLDGCDVMRIVTNQCLDLKEQNREENELRIRELNNKVKARITIFNKRRNAEVEEMKVADFLMME
ncbi:hypothetical protein DPMN_143283 [Dreissena polymorpha]|uniref:Uncharacterized protein n=1 Tax=Dreissena polymorpha TaxID=45954 RepID=A0A9D4JN24_DREPO|nr:hypothetical protein DPMN_143283 [Dreissena polymorpha]